MDTAMEKLRPLGRIVRLQIQRSALKLGEKPNRVYDPAPLLPVDELTITRDGALVRTDDGGTLLDVHNANHPATRNNGGANDLSVGFTGHYDQMRARYGDHLLNGCAGENILVAADGTVALTALAAGLVVRRADTGALVALGQVRVDLPCVEFSRYTTRTTDAEPIKAALQFLDHGMRGYYCTFDADPVTISVGDELLAVAA
jgi:hypothetical protein